MSMRMLGRAALVLGLAATMFVAAVTAKETLGKPDSQMQAVLDKLSELGGKPLETLTPAEARKQPGPADAVKAVLEANGKGVEPEPVGEVKDVTFTSGGTKLPARVYTPEGEGPFPVLVYFHGGGWVIGSLDAYDASCRALCNAAGCLVVSCDYRRAPEHPFPAATDDALAAYQWALEHAAEWNGDVEHVAIGGESAGGNLAAVTCLRAREEAIDLPVHQLLVYPVTNDKLDTTSYVEHADAKPLNRVMMEWFFKQYVGSGSLGEAAFPLQAADLSRLPPATIITADIDPLRDDGKGYAAALEKSGVKVRYKNYAGVTHEFFGMGAVVDKAKEAVEFAAVGVKGGE